ncbi:MAG: DUF5693 family protein [Armatimonadota bacterium]|nr:DUF5693 family protein [Armatimonadota bacterium]
MPLTSRNTPDREPPRLRELLKRGSSSRGERERRLLTVTWIEPFRKQRILAVLIGIGLLASLAILAGRAGVEAHSRQVEIVLDEPSWRFLASRAGLPPEGLFAELKKRGATSLALYEATLRRLQEAGTINYAAGAEILSQAHGGFLPPLLGSLVREGKVSPYAVYVFGPPSILGELGARFQDYLGATRVRLVHVSAGSEVLEVQGDVRDLEEMGLGFLPGTSPSFGLRVVLRLRNYRGLSAEGLERRFSRYTGSPEGTPVIFELTEVLGAEHLIKPAAEQMKRLGFQFGRIEAFSEARRQRGEESLARLLAPTVIRVFSIPPEELNRLAPSEAVDKYLRAARERNIRILYIRPFLQTSAGVDAISTNLEYVTAIARGLKEQGFKLGPAQPLPSFYPPRGLFYAVAAGALAGGALLLGLLLEGLDPKLGMARRYLPLLVLLGLGVTVLFRFAGPFTLWRKLLALGTAVAFPTLGLLLAIPVQGAPAQSQYLLRSLLLRTLGTLWLAALFSVVGGLLVAALLSQWTFMMAMDTFMGVKINYLLPPVLVAFLLWTRARPEESGYKELWHRAGAFLVEPLRVWHAVLLVVLAGAFGVLLLRTGNIGLPLPAVEEKIRVALEHAFIARPRTKEYLIGHPALMMAGALSLLGWWRWAIPLAALASIGQVSMVNSFSHIHTPVLYTLWRTLGGLGLGSVMGLLAVALLVGFVRLVRPSALRGP